MKIKLLFLWMAWANVMAGQVTCDPVFPTQNDDVTIFFDATKGNGALANVPPPIYAHLGVITNKSNSPTDWRYVKTTWGVPDPKGLMTTVAPNLYKISFNIQQFFGVPAGEEVKKLAFVFRNANGSVVGRAADGSDIFYDVYPATAGLQTVFILPAEKTFIAQTGQDIPVKAAASKNADMRLLDNGVQVFTTQGKTLETNLKAGALGLHRVELVATAGSETSTSEFSYFVPGPVTIQNPPAGTELGIQYLNSQTVRLSLFAPKKSVVHVLGDFNDWKLNPNFQMKRSTDGNIWWLEIDNLTPGKTYGFQYLVDGGMKIADPYSTLILDPWNDAFIPPLTFPNLPPYPVGKTTGTVSVLQTAQPQYQWQTTQFTRPKNTELVIYELLLRDFVATQNYQTLFDTLDYLQRLGINALELMPINEFGGNLSWGYNPDYHMALDKFYGSPEAFKRLVDECHRRGIAVILDVVFNHITGASPLAQLYWDAANNRPAADNPWLNVSPKHDFNVFNDMNHDSPHTQDYMIRCLKYWLTEFRVDGFRFDLSKGFTQKNTLGNVAAWGQYDAARVALWKHYADRLRQIDPNVYLILEHFAENTEEKELADYGFMLWGNLWGPYKELALGHSFGANTNLTGISHHSRGWSKPHLVGYFESHDEDRIGYECKTYGNSATPGYDVKNKKVWLRRLEMLNALFYTVPGPKMLWQFGEWGYDFSINHCTNGTVNNQCRLDPKPIRWDYYQDPERRRVFEVVRALIHLRKTTGLDASSGGMFNPMASGKTRWNSVANANYTLFTLANGSTTSETLFLSLGAPGTWWYEYFSGDSVQNNSGGAPLTFNLKPGEYRIYLNKKIPLPEGVRQALNSRQAAAISAVKIYPNPSAQGYAMLDFTLLQPQKVRIALFDVAGKQLYTLLYDELPAGDHQLPIQVNLPPGMYWVQWWEERGATHLQKWVIR